MITFKTNKERKEHPQARFIPKTLWIDERYFGCSLDELLVSLMAASKEELTSLLTPDLLTDLRLKSKTVWLAIALSHPDSELKTLRDIAFQLELNEFDLYDLLITLNNTNLLDEFTSAGLWNRPANDYSAYWLAADAGSVEALKYLEFKAPGLIQAMIKAGEYSAYRFAAENNKLEVLKHLELQAPTLIQAMIQAIRFYAYRLAATNGHVEVLKHLESLVTDEVLQEMIKADKFHAYNLAAQHGHLKVLEHLESKVSKEILEAMIQENSYYAYRLSAQNGYLEIVKHLELVAPHHTLAMIQASEFYAYRFSAYFGYLESLKHFEVQAPDQVLAMIQASGFYAFRYAVMNKHFDVIQHILSHSSACLGYAESSGLDYVLIVNPFIQATLAELHQAALNIPAQEVFDIIDREQAKIGFYLLRALIRANKRSSDDDLRFLLGIPAVRALAHQEVTEGKPNELLSVALESGNEAAASLLLTLPEVRHLAEQYKYYQDERQRLNLAQLARDCDSSLTALTPGELNRLQTVIAHYKPQLAAEGVPRLMQALQEQLIARYQKKPAFIQDSQGKHLFLPLTFDNFQQLALQEEDSQKALIAYYQHKNHSAWRYLQKSNPWMNPEAEYVNERWGKRWSMFEEYQPFIAMLWLAASDAAVPPVDGYTLEGRINHFFDELAQIGRAHNWNRMRINQQGKEEEYDDLTGDRPSCFSGTRRRLFQAVIAHPLIILLTPDILLEEVRNFARQHFEDQMQSKALTEVKNALADYITNTADLSEASKKLLASLNIPAQKLLDFELNLTHKYGAQYTADLGLRKFVASRLYLKPDSTVISDHYHALMLDGLIGLSTRFFKDKITEVNEAGFFIQKTTQTQATTESPRKRF